MGGGRDHAIRRATLRPWCDGLWEVKEGAPQEDHRRLKKHLPRLLPTLIDAPRLREARLAMGPARPAPGPPHPPPPALLSRPYTGAGHPWGPGGLAVGPTWPGGCVRWDRGTPQGTCGGWGSGLPAGRALAPVGWGGRKRAPSTRPPAPGTHCRMNWMASSYFIPLSMRASATRTGALGRQQGLVAQPPHPPPAPNRPPDETQSRSPHPQGLKGCPDPPSALLSLLCDLRWARQPLCASGSSSVNALVGGSKEGERSRELRSGDQSPRLGSRACALLPARGRDEVTTAAGGSGSDVRRTSSRPTSWNPQTEVVRDVGSAHSRERASQATGTKLEGGCPPRSPSQAGHAVHGHAAARVITELGLQQAQPVLHHLPWRGRPIVKRPVLQKGAACEDPQPKGGARSGAQAGPPTSTRRSLEDVRSPGPGELPLPGSSSFSPPGSLPRTPGSALLRAREPPGPPVRPQCLWGQRLTLSQPERFWVSRPKGSGP